MLAGVCHRSASSVTLPAGVPGAWAVGRPTLHGGPVWLRPVRVTPCVCSSGVDREYDEVTLYLSSVVISVYHTHFSVAV